MNKSYLVCVFIKCWLGYTSEVENRPAFPFLTLMQFLHHLSGSSPIRLRSHKWKCNITLLVMNVINGSAGFRRNSRSSSTHLHRWKYSNASGDSAKGYIYIRTRIIHPCICHKSWERLTLMSFRVVIYYLLCSHLAWLKACFYSPKRP